MFLCFLFWLLFCLGFVFVSFALFCFVDGLFLVLLLFLFFGVSSVCFGFWGVWVLLVLVCFAVVVLECFCYFWFFSCCLFLACIRFVLSVSWSGLGVVLVLLLCLFFCFKMFFCSCYSACSLVLF